MPELVEVEAYRRLAERALRRPVVEVVADDAWYLKRGLDARTVVDTLTGLRFTAARRIGKLLLLDTQRFGGNLPSAGTIAPNLGPDDEIGPVLGLRFGMSGRLVVDGRAAVDHLLYSSNRELERWDRFVVRFDDGGDLRMRDARRLGGVELDPPEARLGPDALGITLAPLAAALAGSTAPLKARLMDQARIAGVGNLAADEILWRAALDPARPASSLSAAELRRLHRHLRATMADLLRRGGSHKGDLMPERRPDGRCPRDGAELVRRTVGGRTTWSCPRHQR